MHDNAKADDVGCRVGWPLRQGLCPDEDVYALLAQQHVPILERGGWKRGDATGRRRARSKLWARLDANPNAIEAAVLKARMSNQLMNTLPKVAAEMALHGSRPSIASWTFMAPSSP